MTEKPARNAGGQTNASRAPQPYRPRQPRNIAALLGLVASLALLAIGGIVYALTRPYEDPDTIKLPEHTTKSLADEQPILPEQATPTVAPLEQPLQPDAAASPAIVTEPAVSHPAPMPIPTPVPPVTPQSSVQPATPAVIVAQQPSRHGKGVIAIVIDDMGVNLHNSQIMAQMPAAINFAYLPYAVHLSEQTNAAFQRGHEMIVHMPMEPDDIVHNNPGPDALLTTLSADENKARMDKNMRQFTRYIGINNHMGSRMTASETAMRPVMAELKQRHLWFLDSRTIGNSVAARLAAEYGVPFAQRDVFLDNVETIPAITAQLHQVEKIADARGYAVAIGHPHDATIAALRNWLTEQGNHITLVPLSTVIAMRFPQAEIPQYAQTRTIAQPISVSQRN